MKKDDQFNERRKFIRFNKNFGINIVSLNDVATLPKLDHEIGVNISLTGILIKCEKPIERDSTTRLKIMLVKNRAYKTIEANAKVVWCNRSFDQKTAYCIGMKFTKLSRSDKATLTWYLK